MPYARELRFVYRNPTRVVFGEGSVAGVALEVGSLGGTRALVVTDEGLTKTDLPERVKSALGDKCVGVFGEVKPDSGFDVVQRGVEVAQELGVDILVSVGGGSSMDSAKGMSIVLKGGGKLSDYVGVPIAEPTVPHIAIPPRGERGARLRR